MHSRAAAARKVFVQELSDSRLIDALNAQSATAIPLRKVGDATHAVSERGRSIASVGQVLLVRIKVTRDRILVEPIDNGKPR